MNLVALILRSYDATRLGQLAAGLGVSDDALRKALAAAVPAIIAGFAGLSSRPGGARRLFDALKACDLQIVANLYASIDAASVALLSDMGLEALSSLLGGAQENAISRALGRFAALDEKQGLAVAGLSSTGVLTQLASVQRSRALDVHGLTSLMNAQRDNIAAALPPGFANLLSGTPLLDTLGSKLASPPPSTAQRGRAIGFAWLAMAPLFFLAGYLLATLL